MKKLFICVLLCIACSYGDTIPFGVFSSGGGVAQTDSVVLYYVAGQPIAGEMVGENVRLLSGFFNLPVVQQAIINAAPEITSDANRLAGEGLLFTYKATATDPESTPVLRFENYPSWLKQTADTLSGIPPAFTKDTSFQVIASDGSLSDTLLVNVIVKGNNHSPDVTSATEGTVTEGYLFAYLATATDPDNDLIKISFEHLPSWLKTFGDTLRGTPYEGAMDTTILIVASDGWMSDSMNIYVKVNSINNPPVILSDTNITLKEKTKLTFVPIIKDPDNTVNPIFKNLPSWLIAKGDTVSGIPGDKTADTSFTVIADDGTTADSATIFIKIIPVNDPPLVLSDPLVQVLVATNLKYVLKYEDPEKDSISVQFKNTPSWMTIDKDTIRGIPPIHTPDTSFLIIISDGVNVTEQNVKVIVRASNTPPVITSSDTATATEDSKFTFKIAVTDPDSTPLSFKYLFLPKWLIANDSILSGTPTRPTVDPVGVKAIVTDGLASDTLTILISVTAVNDRPLITSKPDTATQVTKLFKYQVRAEDEEMGIMAFSLTNPRFGMAIDQSGLFTWTPADSQSGMSTVTITVTDNENTTATQIFPLIVGLDPKPSCKLTTEIPAWTRDSVKVQYTITDNYSDSVSLHLLYWTRSKGWMPMGKVIGNDSKIDPSKYTNSFTWLSKSELGNVAYDSVKIKVVPENTKGSGYEVVSNIFKCDNTPALVVTSRLSSGVINAKDCDSLVFKIAEGSRFDTTTLDTSSLKISGIRNNYSYTKTVTDSSLVIHLPQTITAGDSITVTLSGKKVLDIYGKTIDGNRNGKFEKDSTDDYKMRFSVAYLGDFNRDGKVDFRDFPILSKYWLNNLKSLPADSISEIGPVTGTTPYLITQPDNKFDIQDLGIFVRMWYWCYANNAKVIGPLSKRLAFTESFDSPNTFKSSEPSYVSSNKKPVKQKLQLSSVKKADVTELTMNLRVENINHLSACRYTINYPANTCDFVDADLLMLKATTDPTVLCLQSATTSSVDFQMVRLSDDSAFVSGNGSVAVIKMNKLTAKSMKLSVNYELLNDNGQVIETGLLDTLIPATDETVSDVNVFNVAPNPSRSASDHRVFKIEHCTNAPSIVKTNGGCMFLFSPGDTSSLLPLKGVTISVLNVFGQEVVTATERNENSLKGIFPMQIYWDLRDQYGNSLKIGVYKVRCTWWTSKKKFNSTVLVGVK